jgi:PAS domain S-box-containing protein
MLAYPKEELYRKPLVHLSYPEDQERHALLFRELAEGKRDLYRMEKRFLRRDGQVVWGQLTVSLVRGAGGDRQFAIVMVEDIHKRKQAEEEIRAHQAKLQSLASELSLTEERERRRLATDLHDHIGQALAISKIKLGVLQKTMANQAIAGPLGEIRDLIERMIQDTRSLTFELSLPVLYELGFEAAVEWFAKHVRSQHGIRVEVQKEMKAIPMTDELKVLLFRSVRELMINIVKHAQARSARVSISRNGSEVRIKVEDDGKGMDAVKLNPQSRGTGGFGLFSIRERLHYLGGWLEVESQPDQGTAVTLGVPLQKSRKTARKGAK